MKLSLNTGIEQILYEKNSHFDKNLPENTNTILPSEDHVAEEIDKVFNTSRLEQTLMAMIKPELKNTDILKPDIFSRLFSQMPDTLYSIAEDMNQDNKTALTEAADLLSKDKDLFTLLNFYRNLLVKS